MCDSLGIPGRTLGARLPVLDQGQKTKVQLKAGLLRLVGAGEECPQRTGPGPGSTGMHPCPFSRAAFLHLGPTLASP